MVALDEPYGVFVTVFVTVGAPLEVSVNVYVSAGQFVPSQLEYTPNSSGTWKRPLFVKPVAAPLIDSVTLRRCEDDRVVVTGLQLRLRCRIDEPRPPRRDRARERRGDGAVVAREARAHGRVSAPKFCITNVVTQARLQLASVAGHGPASGFPTNERYTLFAPLVSPLHRQAGPPPSSRRRVRVSVVRRRSRCGP